jgi:hypothetical protein
MALGQVACKPSDASKLLVATIEEGQGANAGKIVEDACNRREVPF